MFVDYIWVDAGGSVALRLVAGNGRGRRCEPASRSTRKKDQIRPDLTKSGNPERQEELAPIWSDLVRTRRCSLLSLLGSRLARPSCLYTDAIYATALISTMIPRRFAPNAVRVGYGSGINSLYAALKRPQSSMSARYTMIDTMSDSSAPAACSARSTFLITWRVCDSTSLPTSSPVTGSRGTWPDTNTNGPAFAAGE